MIIYELDQIICALLLFHVASFDNVLLQDEEMGPV